ncbi:MAG TPA: hypothetical protein VK851_10015 [Anaerolineales bacterium]|nr:hypothetical protein [Anaerolineales bacterium]
MPPSARRIALVAFDDSPVRLQALMRNGLERGAAVVLVCETIEYHLPDEVEIQPLSALRDVVAWADYTAFDVVRENLPRLKEMLGEQNQVLAENESQVLIQTSMPCGGIAECGVCAVTLKSKWKLACKDGPVFDWREL